jgi:uncharacterized small protein (DUF1192 family)
MRLNFIIKLLISIALVSSSMQWGIFNRVVNAVTNTARAIVQTVQTIKDNAYAFLSPNNIFVSGKCSFQGRTWDCTVTASNGIALEVSGNQGNVNNEYRIGGAIRIPYAYITGVTTSQRQYTVAFVRFTERTYYINIDRLGAKDTLVIDQNHPDSVNSFINNINANLNVRTRIVSSAKNSIIRVASIYNTQMQFINTNRNEYNSSVASVANLNQRIANSSNEITRLSSERNSLTVTNTALNRSVANLLNLRDQRQKIVNTCDSEIVATNNLLTTYIKYKDEFSEDEASQYLYKENSNLCLFHLSAQDVGLIIPSQGLNINKMRKEVTTKRNIKAVSDLFESNEFFVLKDK